VGDQRCRPALAEARAAARDPSVSAGLSSQRHGVGDSRPAADAFPYRLVVNDERHRPGLDWSDPIAVTKTPRRVSARLFGRPACIQIEGFASVLFRPVVVEVETPQQQRDHQSRAARMRDSKETRSCCCLRRYAGGCAVTSSVPAAGRSESLRGSRPVAWTVSLDA
jgi:hypothetical protein